ncbi:MAG: glutathione S-transferase [Alphaproteobacteria bacterium]|nr:glutathione S-transferase [Alphaproteobacteria bacterium]
MLIVHHLNESRSQRVLWLLEELETPYEIALYARDPQTRLAPPELKSVHALGKSPVITDGATTLIETGAIVDYILRHHGGGRMAPATDSPDYDRHQQWLHYAEGSAMLPLMLNMYVGRLKEAGAPLHPRIESEIANHLSFIEGALQGRDYFVGDRLTGADVTMSFVAEVARAQGKLAAYPTFDAWLDRMHARAAWRRALDKGGAYMLGR